MQVIGHLDDPAALLSEQNCTYPSDKKQAPEVVLGVQ
jgi:hypothetical protein